MIGLEFITQVYGKNFSELASDIGVSRQTMNDWIKERKRIPEKRIEQLQKVFPHIPSDSFGKELTNSEKIKIQEIYFTVTDSFEEIEVPFIDDEGIEHMTTQVYSEHQGIIEHLRTEHEKASMIERYEQLGRNKKMLVDKLVDMLEANDDRHIQLLEMMCYYVHDEKQWGFDPFFAASQKEVEMYQEFSEFLIKYGIIDNR